MSVKWSKVTDLLLFDACSSQSPIFVCSGIKARLPMMSGSANRSGDDCRRKTEVLRRRFGLPDH